jgi:hypothetical protein
MWPDEMHHVTHTPRIDLRPWTFLCITARRRLKSISNDNLGKIIGDVATDVIQSVFDEDPPQLNFGIEWGDDEDGHGGPAPADAATMYVRLPLGPSDDGCVYAVSLEGAVDHVIELYEDIEGKVTDPKGQEVCRKIATRLRVLAAKLDAAGS